MQKNHLTSKLFIPILLLSLLTFGFSFNRYVAPRGTGVNSYLVIFIGFLITIISLFIIKSLACKYPDQTIIHLGNKLLGTIGKIGTPVWLIVIFILTALLAGRVTDEVSAIILFRTPGYVSMLAFLLITGYMALLGEEALGRLSSIIMFMIPLLLIMLILSFRRVNLANIHPVNIYRDLGYLKQWDLWLLVFSPVWILSLFNGHESLRNCFRTVILSLTCGTIILGATSLAVAGSFGAKGMARYEWPVMSLMNITEFAPGYFFQNFITTFFFVIFISFAAVTVAGFLIVLSKGFTEFFGLKNTRSKLILVLIIAALIVLSVMSTPIHHKETASFLLKAGSFYTVGYIVLLWFGSLFQRREQK